MVVSRFVSTSSVALGLFKLLAFAKPDNEDVACASFSRTSTMCSMSVRVVISYLLDEGFLLYPRSWQLVDRDASLR